MAEPNIAVAEDSVQARDATNAAVPPGGAISSRYWKLLQRAFSFPAMLGAFLVGKMFYEGRKFLIDPDVWWHIKTGQAILTTHHLPTVDPYSFTVHLQPWIAYEWLGEVATALVANLGGLRALDFYLIALGSAVLMALYYLGMLRSGNSKAGFVAAGLLSSWTIASFTLRPQMWGYLFLVLTLICLELFRQGKTRALWFLPVIMLVWVNTHGSFIIGLGVTFLCLLSGLFNFKFGKIYTSRWSSTELRQLSTVFLGCLALLPLTPYGIRLALYPFDMAFSQPLNVASVHEWQAMSFGGLGGKMFLAFVMGFFILQTIFEFEWRLEELVLFFGGAIMAFLHLRLVMLFVPFTIPLFAVIASRWLDAYSRAKDKPLLNAVLIAGVIAAMVHFFPSRAQLEERVAEKFPVAALQYLREHPVSGPMYDTYFFGGYLVWSGYPTFIDGRGDIFERGGVFADYMQVALVRPDALSILDKYGIRACLVERDEAVSSVLSASPEWRRIYADNLSALYVRTSDQSSAQWNSSTSRSALSE